MNADALARARKSWDAVLKMEPISSQSLAAALWASLWADALLKAADVSGDLDGSGGIIR